MTHTVNSERSLESYVDGYYSQLVSHGERLLCPPSKHILLAACEREKPAFEGHDRRGIFSNILLATLNKCKNDISYADLFLRIRATVRRVAFLQTPQFEVFHGFNSNGGFLNRAVSAVPRRLTVYFENEAWNVDYGAINGLSSTPDHPANFLIYDESRLGEPIGSGKPATVSLAKSQLRLDGFKPNKLERYVAELGSLPTASLAIDCLGNSQVVQAVKAFQLASEEHRGIILLDDGVPCCDYRIVAEDDRLLFQREKGELIQGVKGVSGESIRYLFDKIVKDMKLAYIEIKTDLEKLGRRIV